MFFEVPWYPHPPPPRPASGSKPSPEAHRRYLAEHRFSDKYPSRWSCSKKASPGDICYCCPGLDNANR